MLSELKSILCEFGLAAGQFLTARQLNDVQSCKDRQEYQHVADWNFHRFGVVDRIRLVRRSRRIPEAPL